MSDGQTKKRENVGREKSLRQVIIVCVLLVDVLSELRERRRCPSRVLNVHLSWQFLFFQRYTNSTAHQSSQPGGAVMLSYWLEKWWLSACVGAVLSGCIVSGCLCNLDVHREAKFSIMMWSHAIKTLVYSLVCLYFGQFIVYIIKYVEVFQVYCLILYPRASCKCHFTLCREISVKRSLLYVWPCRRKKILVSRSALSEPRWLLPLFVYCKKKRVLLCIRQHCNLQRAISFNCKVKNHNTFPKFFFYHVKGFVWVSQKIWEIF